MNQVRKLRELAKKAERLAKGILDATTIDSLQRICATRPFQIEIGMLNL